MDGEAKAGRRLQVRRGVVKRDPEAPAARVPASSDNWDVVDTGIKPGELEQAMEEARAELLAKAPPRRRSRSGIKPAATPTIPDRPLRAAPAPAPAPAPAEPPPAAAPAPAPETPPMKAAEPVVAEPEPEEDLEPLPVLEFEFEVPGGTVSGPIVPLDKMIQYQKFVGEYLQTLDGAEAAKAAGLGTTRAQQQGHASALLRNPVVRTMIERQYRAIMVKTSASVERVWEEIAYAAFLDPGVLYNEDGEALPMAEIPEYARRALTEYKVKEGTIGEDGAFIERTLKFGSKDRAIEKLMRLHRMVDNDKMVLVNGDEFLAAMEEGRQRAASR